MEHRKERIEWDDYFIHIADSIAKRSPDPNTQVGAVIVDDMHRIVSTGYNGLPYRMDNEDINWAREGLDVEQKYKYIVHAEQNAIISARRDLSGCSIYVTLFPCSTCAKLLSQAGIDTVYYRDQAVQDADVLATIHILESSNISVIRLKSDIKK